MSRLGSTMDIQTIVGIIVGILAPLGTFIAGVMLARGTSHKNHAEARAVDGAAQAAGTTAQIEALRAIIAQLQESYKTLSDQSQDDWHDLNERLKLMEQERADFLENTKRLQEQLTRANSELSQLRQRVAELEAVNARKDIELERKNREINDYQNRLALAIAELDRARNDRSGL